MIRAFLIAFFLLAASASAAPPKPQEAERVSTAQERGALIFALDRAAWVTTDDMKAKLGSRSGAGIRGWVVERGEEPGAYVVTYFGNGAAGPFAIYSGRVRDGKVVAGELFADGAGPPLSPPQLRLKEAADTARRFTKYKPCTARRFNVAVIPPEGDGPIDTYLLTAQTDLAVYPMGGHYLLRVQGGKVVSHRPFMKSCMNLDTRTVPGEGNLAAVVVSHLLDPSPTEIHVFMSIWMGRAVYVMTSRNDRLWEVEAGRIRAVDRKGR
jgi:hypothetical protein